MTEQSILVDRTDGVATVTLNLVERRNALTADSKEALREAVADVAKDPGVRAVVLASAGKGVLRRAGPRRACGDPRCWRGGCFRDRAGPLFTNHP